MPLVQFYLIQVNEKKKKTHCMKMHDVDRQRPNVNKVYLFSVRYAQTCEQTSCIWRKMSAFTSQSFSNEYNELIALYFFLSQLIFIFFSCSRWSKFPFSWFYLFYLVNSVRNMNLNRNMNMNRECMPFGFWSCVNIQKRHVATRTLRQAIDFLIQTNCIRAVLTASHGSLQHTCPS